MIIKKRRRKSLKLFPGINLNFGRKSASVSIGVKGFRHNISTTGRHRTTVGGYEISTGKRKAGKQPSKPNPSTYNDSKGAFPVYSANSLLYTSSPTMRLTRYGDIYGVRRIPSSR